jgi:predicted site-specific integrase-resolvase
MGGTLLATDKPVDDIEKLPPALTLARAAEVAGRSRRTMRRWVRQGIVQGHRPMGGKTLLYIDTRSLLRLLGVKVREE